MVRPDSPSSRLRFGKRIVMVDASAPVTGCLAFRRSAGSWTFPRASVQDDECPGRPTWAFVISLCGGGESCCQPPPVEKL